MRLALIACIAFMSLLAVSRPVQAQRYGAGVAFPADAASWINSPPVSVSSLAGKGVVLQFYEEDCPSCRSAWPGWIADSRKFDGQPVVFIAVNSGNSRNEVQSYVNRVGIPWPVIVDTDRSLEKACLSTAISLRNIHQNCIITADGKLQSAAGLQDAANSALRGAAWRVDPKHVPDGLKAAWVAIELGNYSAAASAVKRALSSAKADDKAGAEKLNAAIADAIAKRIADAKTAMSAGNKWQAYQTYSALLADFKGYDPPDEVPAQEAELAEDPDIKQELAAARQLATARRLASRRATQRRAVTILKSIVQEYPQTEAGRRAEEVLAQIGK